MTEVSNQMDSVDKEFTSENEHWNAFSFKVHCNAIEAGLFEVSAQHLEWIQNAIDAFLLSYKEPNKAVACWLDDLNRLGLSLDERKFIVKWITAFIDNSEFDQDISRHGKLLKSHLRSLDLSSQSQESLSTNIRKKLKEIVETELSEFPKQLHSLEPEKRLTLLCRLLPFILPKVESVHVEYGE